MAHVKTAVSIHEVLFQQAEALAAQMNLSRSKLFALAISEFIEKHQNQHLLEQINAAYDDMPNPADAEQLKSMKAKQQNLLEGQW
jgi:metal-responsive CopG/Arc/MetJ family transcriptional regulator